MRTIVTVALQATPEELDQLRSMGLEIVFHQDERMPVEVPEQYEAAICNGLFLYNDIAKFKKLQYIQLTSAGFDRVPMDYIRAHGIEIHNAAGVYSVPMAEWTVMRILELYKNAGILYEKQTAHRWEKDRSWQELSGKTACIIGYGAYGEETAKRLKAFGVQVIAVNRTVRESPWADAFYPLERLEYGLMQADIVVLAIALTDETRHLMNQTRLNRMKPGAILINAARGGLVEEDALLEALESGHLAGAALDVFEHEPLNEGNQFWQMKQVFLSPHNSFVSNQTHRRLLETVLRNLAVST